MDKKEIANILCSIMGVCMMTAALCSVTSSPVSVQKLLIGLTGFVWFITGYIRGHAE